MGLKRNIPQRLASPIGRIDVNPTKVRVSFVLKCNQEEKRKRKGSLSGLECKGLKLTKALTLKFEKGKNCVILLGDPSQTKKEISLERLSKQWQTHHKGFLVEMRALMPSALTN
ncbi:hypothetical protein Csa_006723 [Cucumis sativus]|uniref:Uncharacterized protein n=1 Tax=Cucumis sativus TaxID=3659 RepID=A0A0A0LN98_CUCSA|nr:hypothetical protein Csa_006723 [Cucumis sativus]